MKHPSSTEGWPQEPYGINRDLMESHCWIERTTRWVCCCMANDLGLRIHVNLETIVSSDINSVTRWRLRVMRGVRTTFLKEWDEWSVSFGGHVDHLAMAFDDLLLNLWRKYKSDEVRESND